MYSTGMPTKPPAGGFQHLEKGHLARSLTKGEKLVLDKGMPLRKEVLHP